MPVRQMQFYSRKNSTLKNKITLAIVGIVQYQKPTIADGKNFKKQSDLTKFYSIININYMFSYLIKINRMGINITAKGVT